MTIPSGSVLATALVSGLLLGGLLAVTALGLDPLLTIPVVAAILFAVAVPAYRVLLEPPPPRGPEPALLTTFALSVIAQNLFIRIWFAGQRTDRLRAHDIARLGLAHCMEGRRHPRGRAAARAVRG